MSGWWDTWARIILPSVGIALMLGVSRMRGLSFQDYLGLRWPAWQAAPLWIALFVALAALEEVVWRALGLPPPDAWGDKYSTAIKVIRVLGMVVLAPVAEELLLRGHLYSMIARTPLKEVGAIVVTSVVFAALHVQYGFTALLFILVNGLFYGTVRYYTGSILLTMLLHGMGNVYAAYQRF